MARYENLFTPIEVGSITIPNRIVRAAHSTGLIGDPLIDYHVARAKGGVGMSTLEATSVHKGAPTLLSLADDSILPFYEKLASKVRPHNMKMMAQAYHPGAATLAPGRAIWSVSATPNPLINVIPVAMTKGMIDEVVGSFAAAARRIRDGGLDGIDIHASSGYLIHEFLSPALNKREDEYGGSLENRMRFLREIISAVRAEVGDDIAVGVRLPNDDYTPGGLDAEQNAQIAKIMDPLVDYISLHMGSYWRFHKLIGLTDEPLGNEMQANNIITPTLSKPTMVVGRIMTLDHASSLVADGQADMVSMVRALIADPELVNKARRLDEHRIRPCIGTNMGCVGRLMTGGVMSCVVNMAAGAESTVSFEPEAGSALAKSILVVGGGVAGLEAARTAAIKGHKVSLHEASSRLGGQVALAASAPHRGDLRVFTDWLESEIDLLGVDVHLNSMVDLGTVTELSPDIVICATGSTPRDDGFQVSMPAQPIPGWDLRHVHNSWEIFGVGGKPDIQGPVVIFDDLGTFDAISVADELLKKGVSITLVSRFETLGQNLPFPPVTVGAARERLMSGAFDFIGGHYLKSITAEAVEIGVLFTDRVRKLPAKTVVLVTFNEPNRWLAEELESTGIEVHWAGDVLGGNSIMSAVHTAAEVARAL